MKNDSAEINWYASDFETTVYKDQHITEVWAAAIVKIGSEKVSVYNSIEKWFKAIQCLPNNSIVYFHNLKFDGMFILDYIMKKRKMTVAYDYEKQNFYKNSEMPGESFKVLISSMGQWYSITIRSNNKIITFLDSLKLLPFSLDKIGKDFQTKHQKLSIEYKGFRQANMNILPNEIEYIKNDVLVLSEALLIMFKKGHKKMTIGANCLSEFYDIVEHNEKEPFIKDLITEDLTKYNIDENQYGSKNADEYIRHAYRGGWCYMVERKKGMHYNGCTADVNSLYPSVMHSELGYEYPIALPTFGVGEIPETISNKKFYYKRFKCKFEIKEGFLPFVQIKGNPLYKSTECLKTSDIYNKKTGEYQKNYMCEGVLKDAYVILTMAKPEYELFIKHYSVYDYEPLDYCYFDTRVGLFDDYINKYRAIKENSTGATRVLAKLFLNNLYGKMATSQISTFKFPYIDDNECVRFINIFDCSKKAGYIPIGAAITAYARCFTITAAQQNYYGDNRNGFIYADTDSIHCDLLPKEVKGIKIDPKKFGHWKIESEWDEGYFVRQKTYIEHIVKKDGVQCEPEHNIVCAGLPKRCKRLLKASFDGIQIGDSEDEKEFTKIKRTYKDFDIGLIIPAKLVPRTINGGVVLTDTTFRMS